MGADPRVPEGDIYQNMERVLTIAACGHLTFRDAPVMPPPHMARALTTMERIWGLMPCPACEPGYIIELAEWAVHFLQDGWSQEWWAETRCRTPVSPLAENAARWSVVGAIMKARAVRWHVRLGDPNADVLVWKAVRGLTHHAVGNCEEDGNMNLSAIYEWENKPGRRLQDVLDLLANLKGDMLVNQATVDEALAEKPEEEVCSV